MERQTSSSRKPRELRSDATRLPILATETIGSATQTSPRPTPRFHPPIIRAHKYSLRSRRIAKSRTRADQAPSRASSADRSSISPASLDVHDRVARSRAHAKLPGRRLVVFIAEAPPDAGAIHDMLRDHPGISPESISLDHAVPRRQRRHRPLHLFLHLVQSSRIDVKKDEKDRRQSARSQSRATSSASCASIQHARMPDTEESRGVRYDRGSLYCGNAIIEGRRSEAIPATRYSCKGIPHASQKPPSRRRLVASTATAATRSAANSAYSR